MYRIDFSGCLISLFLFFLIIFILKELWILLAFLVLIVLVVYSLKLIYKNIKDKELEKRINYEPKMGEVYKVCPYCNIKVKINEKTCPNCKRALN